MTVTMVSSGFAAARTIATPAARPAAAPVPVPKVAAPLPVVPTRPVPEGDEIIAGRGDSDGWHLFAASSGAPGTWQPLASLAPSAVNPDGEPWTGRQCLTGDGRHVVVVVAPWGANNVPAGMDRGGIAYAVDAHTGVVRPLVTGVSLHYFTPSCGTGSTAALTRFVGTDEQTTQVVTVDAATATVTSAQTVAGEVTGAVPAPAGGVIAARGSDIVHIAGGRQTKVAGLDGQPFDLVANAAGGVDFLLGRGKSATIWTADARGARQVGTGSFDLLALFSGRGGRTIAAGADTLDAAAGIKALPRALPTPEAVSLDGSLTAAVPTTAAAAATGPSGTGRLPLRLQSSDRDWTPDAVAAPTRELPAFLTDDGTLVAPVAPSASRATAAAQGTATATARSLVATAASPYVSKCAVARNDVHLQAMQPNAAMVDWAANMAGRSLLAGTHARPAGFDNLGLPGYAPSAQSDFAMPALSGPGGKTIPREVLEAVWAQESNFKQASWHSIQGLTGNPLIADYYAAGGGYLAGAVTDATGAPNPDCGYGLGQVTTGMRAGDMSYDLQRKVAVDYAENAAASAQILASKWNELINAGITANDGDSDILENWYLAVWDYNSGLHPSTSNPWGLGWLNNPANPAYPYNRHPFLHQDIGPLAWQVTYDDASHPGDWTYPEKIFGWMEVPIKDSLSGLYSYAGTLMTSAGGVNVQQAEAFELARPDRMAFCDTAKNQCDPTLCDEVAYPGTCDPGAHQGTGPCTRSDFECWWHYPVNWCNPITNVCHTGSWELDPAAAEPTPTGATNWYPPVCNVDDSAGGAVPPGSVVVDTQPGAVNLEGCNPATENWRNNGTFTFAYGDAANPAAQATDMDLHQLGAGLGGHMWFTHTGEPTDSSGLSYWGLTGTWTPNLPALGNYTIKVFVPATGATATQANYTVDPGYGAPTTVTVNQNAYTNAWVSLGTYWLGEHADVSLTNLGTTATADLAFTAVAFVPAANPAPYAILGDSYSSGEGTNYYDPDTNTSGNTCHRGPGAFGRVYAASSSTFSGGDVEHLACSGATIDNILTTPKNNEPPQINELMPNARLVTVTVGGNDAGFAGVLTRCVTPLTTCEDYYNQNNADNLDTAIENLRAKLASTYTAIKNKAPGATIVAVTYPNIFSPGSEGKSGKTCLSIGAIGASDVSWLIRETFHLDDVIESAARDAGIQFLDERYAFTGHELCSSAPWVNSLLSAPVTDISKAFHPNASGYAQIAADLKASPAAPLLAGKTGAAANPATPAAATWGGWRNATMAGRMPSTTKALEMFTQDLVVANPSNTSYSDTYFGGWSTAAPSRPGCNRRTLVLERDADTTPPTQHVPSPACEISWGQWQSPYNDPTATNGGTFRGDPRTVVGGNQSPVDVDHVVSKNDAWASGADQWMGTGQDPNEDRTDFANDSAGLELLTVSASTNRSKGAKTPDAWTPDNSGNPAFTCDFLKMYVAVKWQYRLTITLAQWTTIHNRMTVAACGP